MWNLVILMVIKSEIKERKYNGPDSICTKMLSLLNCINFSSATDSCCGFGGMLVQSIKFIKTHHGKKISIYGQEYTNITYRLVKMSLVTCGIQLILGR